MVICTYTVYKHFEFKFLSLVACSIYINILYNNFSFLCAFCSDGPSIFTLIVNEHCQKEKRRDSEEEKVATDA